jgi:polyisoprenoid-binding protein YceI
MQRFIRRLRRKIVVQLVIVALAFGLGIGVGALGLLLATAGPSEPSKDIEEVAPTLSLNDPTPTSSNPELDAANTQVATLSTQVSVQQTQIAELQARLVNDTGVSPNSTADSNDSDDENTTPTPAVTAAPISTTPERALFRIDKEQSEVRFRINETLNNERLEVVGRSKEVAGDVIINYRSPSLSTVGIIAINARTLRTPEDQRNLSIRGQILETRKYEFIFFEPTRLIGLTSQPVDVGSTVEFQVEGNLIIKEVSRPVIFEVSLTAASETEIRGLASTEILYADWGITINPPPFVLGIEDNVILEIEFTALQIEAQ